MNCSFCGRDFDETEGRKKCKSCAMFGGCRNVRCPHCGYEMPEEPGFVKWLFRRSPKKRKENGASGSDSPSADST